jgi:hypothetical protein
MLESLDLNRVRKSGPFLEDCKIFLSGFSDSESDFLDKESDFMNLRFDRKVFGHFATIDINFSVNHGPNS